MSLKLISLNIEGHKHLNRIIPFFKQQLPDVICLQEVFKEDLNKLKSNLYPHVFFIPTWRVSQTKHKGLTKGSKLWGIAVLARVPIRLVFKKYYSFGIKIPRFTGPGKSSKCLLVVSAFKDNTSYIIGTTHFTWTPDGKTSALQLTHLKRLLKILHPFKHLILTGDFNAPRGLEIHQKLTSLFTDHIPKDIKTTVDPKLHYANRKRSNTLQTVVDYIFSTPEYQVKTKVQCGLSDHCAIISDITKVYK